MFGRPPPPRQAEAPRTAAKARAAARRRRTRSERWPWRSGREGGGAPPGIVAWAFRRPTLRRDGAPGKRASFLPAGAAPTAHGRGIGGLAAVGTRLLWDGAVD